MNNATCDSGRILIIDDNERIHEDFRKILSVDNDTAELSEDEALLFGDDVASAAQHAEAFAVDCAPQGEVGVKMVQTALAENRPYSMAFVDMRMPPGWDGIETIEHLWKVDPTLQVVICTAYSDYSWQETIARLGQTDRLLILKKPFEVAEVAQLAASLTRKWDMQRQLQQQVGRMEESVSARTLELHQARDDSEQLLAAISSLLVQIDTNFVVQRWNQRAAEMFGIADHAAIGNRLIDLPIRWVDPAKAESLVLSAKLNGCQRVEIEFRDASDIHRILGVSTYRVEAAGAFRGALLLGTDLTEQRSLEQQLQAAQKLEAVGQLAAGVAHEINTPMQYIGDNLDYLRSSFKQIIPPIEVCLRLLSGEQQDRSLEEWSAELSNCMKPKKLASLLEQVPEAIDDSADGVRSVSKIVRAMKEFSHPGSDQKTSVKLNDALETTLTVARNEWKYVAEVETQFDPDLPYVNAFPGELNQVFLNLVVNAAHAIVDRHGNSGERGQIRISTQHNDGAAEVRISDTGCGIPESAQDRIFDPFFTTKEVGRGTGQGLAIAHSVIVQKHAGKIWFETEAGVGTTFVIRLPLSGDEDRASESVEATQSLAV